MSEILHKIAKSKDLFEKLIVSCKETLGYDKDPTIVFVESEENAGNPLGKTGYYNPVENKIAIYTTGRHVKDVMRSLAHELVHHDQNCRGELKEVSKEATDGYAQNNEVLRTLEREAFEKGNLMFRDFCDGILYGSNK